MKSVATGRYDGAFLEEQTANGLPSARVVVPVIVDLIRPRTVIDLGCAEGAWLRAFVENGVTTVRGFDGPWVTADQLLFHPAAFRHIDLSNSPSLTERADLAVCLEVAEHLPERAARPLVQLLTTLAPVVLWSAAVPCQGGIGHVNEQWPWYWESLFSEAGFHRVDALRAQIWHDSRVAWYYRQNLVLYISASALSQFPNLRAYSVERAQLELVEIGLLRRYTHIPGLLRELGRLALAKVSRAFR